MPTVIDNDGGLYTVNNQFMTWVSQDANGDSWAIWGEFLGSVNQVWINRQVSGVWQTKQRLFGAAGGLAGAYNAAYAAGAWNSTRTKLYVRVMRSSSATLYITICTNLADWSVAGGWFQNDEVTNGADQISATTSTVQHFGLVRDSAGNLYTGSELDSTRAVKVFKRLASTKVWSEATADTSGSVVRGMGICVDSSDFIHVVHDDSTIVEYVKSTNASDITAWSAPVQVIGGNATTTTGTEIIEEANGKFVVVCFVAASTVMKWNYWNGSSWTQGTTGSTTGLGGRTAAKSGALEPLTIAADGANNVYFIFLDTTAQYQMVKFNGTGWDDHVAFNPGAGDASSEPVPDQDIPSTATTAGVLYYDLAGGAADNLVFDTFAVSAAPVGAAGGGIRPLMRMVH